MFRPQTKKFIKFSLVLLFTFSASVYPQFQRQNFQILGIAVEGNNTADASTIIANSGLKIGDEIEIPGDQTLNAIKRLWSLGLFKPNIEIVIDKKIETGVFLLIKVEEYPRMETYVIVGNDEIDESDLDKEINLRHMMKPLTYDELIEMVKKAGFESVQPFWQNYNFIGIIAIKKEQGKFSV